MWGTKEQQAGFRHRLKSFILKACIPVETTGRVVPMCSASIRQFWFRCAETLYSSVSPSVEYVGSCRYIDTLPDIGPWVKNLLPLPYSPCSSFSSIPKSNEHDSSNQRKAECASECSVLHCFLKNCFSWLEKVTCQYSLTLWTVCPPKPRFLYLEYTPTICSY